MEEKRPKARREYKDTVFRMLFSDEKNLLSLYNAVTGRSYEDAKELEIVTLDNAVYMGMKNDRHFYWICTSLCVQTRRVDEEPEHATAGSVLYFFGISEVCE